MVTIKKGSALSFATAMVAAIAIFAVAASASAATIPNLSAASTFSILSGANAPGEVGMATQAQIAVLNAYTNVQLQTCDQTLTGTVNGTTLNPGLTCLSSTSTFSGPLTLNASGNAGNVFIIQALGANLTLTPSSTMLSNGAIGSNVLIVAEGNVTVPAGAVIDGTIIAKGNITIDPSARVNGHVFSTNGIVTATASSIVCPECVTNHPTLTINKTVVNDNGGVGSANDFLLLINDMETMSGRVNILAPGTYVVGELNSTGYTPSFSGACGAGGSVTVSLGQNVTCNMVNNDIGTGGVGLPNTGAGGGFADMLFWAMRTLLIAVAAAGLTFVGLRALKVNRSTS